MSKKKYKPRNIDQMADDLEDGLESINTGMVSTKRRNTAKKVKYGL